MQTSQRSTLGITKTLQRNNFLMHLIFAMAQTFFLPKTGMRVIELR